MPAAALSFADSFQYYDRATQGGLIYTSSGLSDANGGIFLPSSTILPGSTDGAAWYTLQSEVVELTAGIRHFNADFNRNEFQPLLTFFNEISGLQFNLHASADGRLNCSVKFGGERIGGYSTKSLKQRTWYYYELYAQFIRHHQPYVPPTSTTPAIYEYYYMEVVYFVYVNEELWLSGTIFSGNRNTDRFGPGDGTAELNPWILHCNIASVQFASLGAVTDFYITVDGSDQLGDVQVVPLFPTSDGQTGWTPAAGSSHYQMVNTHPPNGLTYNVGQIGEEDSYGLQTLPAFTGEIKGTVAVWYLTLEGPGAGACLGYYGVDTNTSNYAFYPSFGSWLFFLDAWRLYPNGIAEWTQAEINGIHLGIERLA